MRSRLLVVLFTVFGLFWSLQLWAEDSPKAADAPAELKVANRSVMVFRATLLGEAPASRVKRAKAVIGEALEEADDLKVTLDPIMKSYMVLLGRAARLSYRPRMSTKPNSTRCGKPPKPRLNGCVRWWPKPRKLAACT